MDFIKNNPTIYILSGKASNGKNLAAKIISKIYNDKQTKSINLAYASYLKDYAKNVLDWDGSESTKPRSFLQQLGVDLIKNKIDNKFLINRMLQDINIYSYFYKIITISDARFIDEIETIKSKYDKVIVIHIYGIDSKSLTKEERKHISETALDDYNKYDYEIDNSKSIEELEESLFQIVKEVEHDSNSN
ncbi:MAG: hypothetical protein PHD02_02400 [Bacilli bacterium]|nr:hypothetical protein [Bacilli bacterium]